MRTEPYTDHDSLAGNLDLAAGCIEIIPLQATALYMADP
jgi:hypothetical protein